MERQTLSRERLNSIMARFERRVHGRELTLEEKVRQAVRAAKMEMTPDYVAILRNIQPGVRMLIGFELWDMAAAALYRQELDRGLSPEAAGKSAAQRMLALHNDI